MAQAVFPNTTQQVVLDNSLLRIANPRLFTRMAIFENDVPNVLEGPDQVEWFDLTGMLISQSNQRIGVERSTSTMNLVPASVGLRFQAIPR